PLTLLQADVEILTRALRPLSAARALALPTTASGEPEAGRNADPLLVLPQADREILAEMADEIGHMNTLVADLLTLARYDASVPAHRAKSVSLTSLLTALAERVSAQVAQAQLTLHLLLPEEPPSLLVLGDAPALQRLFLILLTNAIQYTPAGGCI